MKLGILVICFALLAPLLRAGDTPALEITYFSPAETYSSFGEYRHRLMLEEGSKDKVVNIAEIEIRDPARNLRVLRFPYVWDLRDVKDGRSLQFRHTSSEGLSEAVLRRLEKVEPGEYHIAVLINGERASNVNRVRIDPAYDWKKVPVLSLSTLEGFPGKSNGRLLVRVMPPSPKDIEFTNAKLAAAPLLVDGIERTLRVFAWTGPVGPFEPGVPSFFIPYLPNYEPPIDLKSKHRVSMKAGPHSAAEIEFDPAKAELGTKWDLMTPKIEDAPKQPVVLRGKVHDRGVGAVAYNVRLRGGNNSNYEEFTNEAGEFEFVNVPSGTYQIGCAPANGEKYSYTATQPSEVVIEAGKTTVSDPSFRTWLSKRR